MNLKSQKGFLSYFFRNKTLIIRTEDSTKYIHFGKFKQLLVLFLLITFIAFTCFFYKQYKFATTNEILLEYDRISKENEMYKRYFSKVSKRLDKINEYMNVIDNDEGYLQLPEDGVSPSVTKSIIEKQIENTYNGLEKRSKEISKKTETLGIKSIDYKKEIKPKNANHNNDIKIDNPQGGPFIPLKKVRYKKVKPLINLKTMIIDNNNYEDKIEEIIIAEKIMNSLPIKPPSNNYRITSRYGIRNDPIIENKIGFHNGIDIVIKDDNIYAPNKGKVVFVGKKFGYGNCIEIEHSDSPDLYSVKTLYGHLEKINVELNQEVDVEDIIGIQGNDGRSTGKHLHYEILINNKSVNPYKFMTYNV